MKLRLKETDDRGVYEATVDGKSVMLAIQARDRKKEEWANQSVTVRPAKIRKAVALAGNKPVYVGVIVTVKGKFNQALAVPMQLWRKVKTATSDFSLSKSAREDYAQHSDVLNFVPAIAEAGAYGPKEPRKSKKSIK